MLLKRLLLLPEKGDVIICILLILNILCGEPVESVSSEKVPAAAISFMHRNNFIHLSPRRLSGTVLVTVCYLISTFHLPKINAEESVSLDQRPIHQPVLKKTDLPMIKRTGATNGSNYESSDYNKREDAMRYGESVRIYKQLVNASESVGESSKPNKHGATEDHVKLSLLKANLISMKAHKKNGTLQKATNRRAHTQTAKQSGNHSFSNLTKLRRRPKLLKELTMYNRQNCLAKLLCGVQVARPPTKSSSAVNDYAYLVKAFFDRFSIRGIVTDAIDAAFEYERDALDGVEEEDEEEEDDFDSDKRKKKKQKNSKTKIGGAALHKSRRPAFENYNPKYYSGYDEDLEDLELEELLNDDIPDFMTDDYLIKRSGKKLTHVTPFRQLNCNDSKGFLNGTNDTIINQQHKRSHLLPVDLNRIRKQRGFVGDVKRGFMGFFNPRFDKTAYLDKRQLDLHSTQNEAKQLNIAEEIAARIRSPRQCRLLNWFGNSNGLNNGNQQNGLTTTITTITNTGGMVGNMERLSGLQNVPQTGSGTGALGQPSSQVVTVIQQSPAGQGQASSSGSSTTAPSTILNTMGQSASTAMNVASQIGSTICPFNTQELQDLILKAQTAPFPHFLTTTPATSPIFPAQINQAISSTASTSTQKATQAPHPSSSTMAIVMNQGGANSDRPYAHIYGNYPHPQPIFSNFPAQVYPTPFVSESKFSHQTNQPQLLPPLGIAVEDDDEGDFEDDPYALNLKPVVTKVKVKPTPKWMTTTPRPLDDTIYSYNEPLPKYSYNKQKLSSYKVSPKPKPQKQTQTQSHNYLRQFHQPPIVFDSKKHHMDSTRRPTKPTVSTKKVVPNAGKKKKTADINPKQKVEWNSDSEEDNSDEENSETTDGNDDEESEETNSAESGSVEPRSNLNLRNKFTLPLTFKRPPAPQFADLEDDVSNEADEKKEKDAEGNGDEEYEEEDSDEEENGGKRSYEKNDFSKDRGGPPTQSTTTMKPKTYANANFNNAKSGGFMSQFFSSLTSMFNRKDDGSKIRIKIKTPFKKPLPPRPLEIPPTHAIKPLNSNMMDVQNESDEPDGGDEGQDESDENENDEYSDEGKAATQQGNIKQSEAPVWVIQQPEPKPIQDPTLFPVIIEDSTIWANPFQGPGPSPKRKIYGEDDSGEPHLRKNPVESYTAALKQKQHEVVNPQILSNNGISSNPSAITGNANPQFDPNFRDKSYQFHDLPISSELRNWILDVTKDHGLTRQKEKEVKVSPKDKTPSDESDEEYDDDEESNESDEDDVSQSHPRSRRIPEQRQVSYVPPPEPID